MIEEQCRNDLEPRGFENIVVREDAKGDLIHCEFSGIEAQARRSVPEGYFIEGIKGSADEPTMVRLRPKANS